MSTRRLLALTIATLSVTAAIGVAIGEAWIRALSGVEDVL